MSIKVENITKLYGAQKALNDVSFEVKSGEVIGFLGPNGAGKSTMMKIITCFLPQTDGNVSVCGFDVVTDPIEVKKRVGYLPEHNPLYLDMYVKEYLEFCANINHIKTDVNKRINHMIDITGLQAEQKKKIGALSKGYRQRVGLAQALIHNPEVLILDEPTSGLDPNQLTEIRSLIKEVGKEKTVILSTHIMQEVKAMCSRAIIINKGLIVADDNVENLHGTSGDLLSYIIEFDKKAPLEILRRLKGVNKVQNLGSNKYRLTLDSDIRKELFKFAVDNNLSILTQQKEEQNLEEIFQQLTKSK